MHKPFERGEKSGEKKSKGSEKARSRDSEEMVLSAQSSSDAVPVGSGPTAKQPGPSEIPQDADNDRNGLRTLWTTFGSQD